MATLARGPETALERPDGAGPDKKRCPITGESKHTPHHHCRHGPHPTRSPCLHTVSGRKYLAESKSPTTLMLQEGQRHTGSDREQLQTDEGGVPRDLRGCGERRRYWAASMSQYQQHPAPVSGVVDDAGEAFARAVFCRFLRQATISRDIDDVIEVNTLISVSANSSLASRCCCGVRERGESNPLGAIVTSPLR